MCLFSVNRQASQNKAKYSLGLDPVICHLAAVILKSQASHSGPNTTRLRVATPTRTAPFDEGAIHTLFEEFVALCVFRTQSFEF